MTINIPRIDLPPSEIIDSVAQLNPVAPSADSAIAISDIATPSVATPIALPDYTATSYPLNHARLLVDNFALNATASATGGTSPTNALKPNTWEQWRFEGTETITIVLPVNQDIDSICIGAHNLGSKMYVVGADYSVGASGAWIQFNSDKSPDTDAPLYFYRETTVSARRIRIHVTNAASVSSYIGYISVGLALQMPRPFFGTHQPITDADVTEYYKARTESGQIIGRTIRRLGYETQYDWSNIDDNWYRTNFPKFKEKAKILPVFIAWNLADYPDDIGFGVIDQDIRSPYIGTKKLRSISFKLTGL